MTPSGPILVLFVAAGGGHKTAAQAIAEAARAVGREVEVLDALSLTPRWFARAYLDLYRVSARCAPTLYGSAYAVSNRRDGRREPIQRTLDHAVDERLVEHVLSRDPRAVIATHFHPLVELGRMRRERRLGAPVVAVVTDYVAHAAWVAPGIDLYCTAAARAPQDLRTLGTFGAPIVETGIPVRLGFANVPPWQAPRAGEPVRVLVTAGGFGVGPVLEVMRSFRGRERVMLDVVCGDRPSLVRRARRLAERHALAASVMGFAHDMADRIAAAHVVVGKSGGLTMSECLAAGRPLIVVGACPGQEAGNLTQLEDWFAGTASRARYVGTLVVRMLEQRRLARMAESARRHGIPDAASRVLAAVQRLVAGSAPREVGGVGVGIADDGR